MKIIEELSIADFEVWSGGIDTKKIIIDANKAEEFDQMIEELYPDGLTATQLNDLLWFEPEWIFETLDIPYDNDEDEEDEEE